jgi:hypothetical protein
MRKQKFLNLLTLIVILLAAAQPAMAAQEEGVSLPGWTAWLMVVLAIGVPTLLAIYLKGKGRL